MVWKQNGKITDKFKPMPKFWIQICKNPTDTRSNFGIDTLEYLIIPMEMEISTCRITTHPHTLNDIHNYRYIILSDEFYLDPSKHLFAFLQRRRSIGQAQIFIIVSILTREKFQAQLQLSSVDILRES